MDGRVYDPALGRFLSPDNYVQLPENSQSFNRYSYCFNNPLKFTDPDGNWAVWDDIVAMLTGGTINLLCNIENLVSPIHAACSFAVGAAAGEATLYGGPMAGAAVSGVGNSCVNQLFQNGNINGAQVLTDGMISMGCSYLGGMMGDKLSKPINSLFGRISNNILRDVVSNATCNSIVGFGLGGAASFLDSETSFWDGALHGAGIGFVSGAITGVAQGISENRQARASRNSVQENLRGYDEIPPQSQNSTCTDLVPYYPQDDGALGAWRTEILEPGTLIDRYGGEYGRFLSPVGTPIDMRAMPPGNPGNYHVYKVTKTMGVYSSRIAPAFGKIGCGIQYKAVGSVGDMLNLKYIIRIK